MAACSAMALGGGFSPAASAQETPAPEASPPPTAAPPPTDEQKGAERRQIVVIGDRAIIASLQNVRVERTYDDDDVSSYGADTAGEVIDQIRQENGDEQPSVLVNGQPVPDTADIANYPPEAIKRIEVLPRGAAQRIGGAPGQRAYNIVLKPSVKSAIVTAGYEKATEGGWQNRRGEALLTYIHEQDRLNLTLRGADSDKLFESERSFVPRTESVPYSPVGNIVPVAGAEIDPALSALAGHLVSVTAVPAGNTQPTLADFLAGADTINPSQQNFYRTLRGSSTPYELAVSGNKALASWLALSFNGQVSWLQSSNNSGLPSGRFLISGGNQYTPFTTPVYLALNDPSRPLRSVSHTTHETLSSTLDATFGEWHWTLAGRWDRNERNYMFQYSGSLGAASTVGTSVNPFAGTLASLIPIESRVSRSTTTLTQMEADLEGPLFNMPAGPARGRLTTGLEWDAFDADDFTGTQSLRRHDYGIKAALTLALTSDRFLPILGESDLALELGVASLGRYGTLDHNSIAYNWQPVNWFRLVASSERDERAVAQELLAAPEVIAPNVPYFDPLTGDTVDVTTIYGGAGNLRSEDWRTKRLSATFTPLQKYRLQFSADYLSTDIRNQIGSLPPPSSAIVAAFPDRFQRDPSGTLVLVDERTINFARQHDEEVRLGVGFTIPLSKGLVIPADRKAGTPRRTIPPLNLQVNASQTFVLESRTVITAGLPAVDLLKGGAIGIGGGQQRLMTDVNVALTKGGSGVRVSLRRRGASYLVTGTPGAPNLLTFSPLTTLDAKAFADLGKLFPGVKALKGARITVDVRNLANERQTVTDEAGVVPQAYQPVRRDPVGRTLMVELRKVF